MFLSLNFKDLNFKYNRNIFDREIKIASVLMDSWESILSIKYPGYVEVGLIVSQFSQHGSLFVVDTQELEIGFKISKRFRWKSFILNLFLLAKKKFFST